MKDLKLWHFCTVIGILLLFSAYCILCKVDSNVTIALIAAIGTSVTVIGSVYVNQKLAFENANVQRRVDIRKLKQDYYHKFTEAFMLRIAYSVNGESPEFKIADTTFCVEKNRLPLYASQEIVEYVESVANGQNAGAQFTKLFELIRKDLTSEEFLNFEKLATISVTLPTEITRRGTQVKPKKK